MSLIAAHADMLVLGIASTEEGALRQAKRFGGEPDHLDTLPITGAAASHVRAGGDCRALTLRTDAAGFDFIALREDRR